MALICFYFFSVLVECFFILNKKVVCWLSIVVAAIFLIYLPFVESDYILYEEAYDCAYFMSSFPWFWTTSTLTSEPLYLWYTSLGGVILPWGFPVFLATNFLLCIALSWIVLKRLSSKIRYHFWMMFLPVIFLTVFYYSPRSSISFILVFVGFGYLAMNRIAKSTLCLFLGCMIHSQYLLISLLLLGTHYLLFKKIKKKDNCLLIILAVTFPLCIVLFSINNYLNVVSSILSLLPSGEFAQAKLMYYYDSNSEYLAGVFRLTSILSVVVYPYMAIKLLSLYKRKTVKYLFFFNDDHSDFRFLYLIVAVVLYGAAINIAYYNSPFIAGRLSRFSDYVCMGVLIPSYFQYVHPSNKKVLYLVMALFAILAPFLYGNLYVFVEL